MGGSKVCFSLGSNLGDRLSNLRTAVDRLSRVVADLRVSSLYETAPLYVTTQPLFLNCAAIGATDLAPLDLLDAIQHIERDLGRVRDRPKGPRIIDVDLLLHGKTRVSHPRLELPHPGMRERAFVLVPLLELEPGLEDPVSGVPYSRWLDRLENPGVSFPRAWEAP